MNALASGKTLATGAVVGTIMVISLAAMIALELARQCNVGSGALRMASTLAMIGLSLLIMSVIVIRFMLLA